LGIEAPLTSQTVVDTIRVTSETKYSDDSLFELQRVVTEIDASVDVLFELELTESVGASLSQLAMEIVTGSISLAAATEITEAIRSWRQRRLRNGCSDEPVTAVLLGPGGDVLTTVVMNEDPENP
jgi:hypothetical protein